MWLELLRQLRRRRTYVTFALVVGLPILIVTSIAVGGGPGDGRQGDLVDVASRSGINAAFFCLQAASGFLLVVVVAMFAGDAVASEASWGSLRYLLVRPIPRWRLLRVKLAVAALLSVTAVLLIPVVGLAAGTVAFGWRPASTPLGGAFSVGTGLERLAAADAYIAVSLAVVLALAFLFSTMTDAPLAAVGGAVVATVVSQILDLVSSLGRVRLFLPTHYWFSWLDLLSTPVPTGAMARGLVSAVPWTVLPLAVAFWHFRRKDVLS
ncbi:MAG: type transport system permease protein [Frankiaceae bacterium]|jgi:ABC-2 type transport system permease protein|nr:type transport system permease protein [Frankiaceae bacterium]MDX6226326.1 type transport system permease protein [Frankiales bacterium]MDX6273327.1 type transport system permease protein [Frankiales bacterium]